jgi:hypothetical protein
MEENEKLLEYLVLIHETTIKDGDTKENIKKFFNVEKLNDGKYRIFLILRGYQSENWHQVIPVGKLFEICLFYGKNEKGCVNIENVFPFELQDSNYNEQREIIKNWFFDKIKI